MEHIVTDRGFKHVDPITCSYGSEVRVYESSNAMEAAIWLKIEQGKHVDYVRNPGGLPQAEAVAHLPLEKAKQLRDQLDWLIANHYQVT